MSFKEKIISNIKNDNYLILCFEVLVEYKNSGMTKSQMISNLNNIRSIVGNKDEDKILEMMDFVEGYCHPKFKVF